MNANLRNVLERSRRQGLHSAGMTLVEIMVALAVGVVLLAGLMQVWSSSRSTYRLAEAQARVQENGRFAIQALASELRATRSPACQSVALGEALDSLNVNACSLLTGSTPAACNGTPVLTTTGAMGFDSSNGVPTGGWMDALPGVQGSGIQREVERRWLRGDVIVSWGVRGDGVYVDAPGGITANRTGTVDIQTFSNDLNAGNLALITDCKSADIFEVTGASAVTPGQPSRLSFNGGPSANTSGQLSYAYNWRGATTLAARPRNRARLYPFEYKVLFVCCMDLRDGFVQSSPGTVARCNTNPDKYRPALCRWTTAGGGQTEQLVGDIADMRVTYDGESGGSRFRDQTATPDAAWVQGQGLWDSVDSLRVQLLATWGDGVLIETAQPNNAGAQADLGFGMSPDRRLYQAFDLTTATRSSAPWYVQ